MLPLTRHWQGSWLVMGGDATSLQPGGVGVQVPPWSVMIAEGGITTARGGVPAPHVLSMTLSVG